MESSKSRNVPKLCYEGIRVNKKDCIHYASGNYCCIYPYRCGDGNKCHTISHCGYGRLRCHIKTDTDKCITFKQKHKGQR